ncbi:Lipoprotein releasing system transmembrane protein LolC [Cystobacter fuscus DSM 2262]|uniref:Lipoprotein releasing system transmembrane protein LolC n=1 Tax=Cystobacter fuscus (strain ATCC 25194 / DSM 2262 / NBRC 100088 / M29) TaxID=1242864 RepID=S9NZW7_CYSF2|nr:ABC transporter permease [Cystobacter fuscus]EPX57735.1 Lipoprotein releasing system transmembrane protein LolC [Cystobacter fuscus DSM 2262]
MNAERQTVYRWSLIWSGVLVALVGVVLLGVAIGRVDAWARVASVLGLSALAWGGLVQTINAVGLVAVQSAVPSSVGLVGTEYLVIGSAAWIVGWVLIASGIRRAPESTEGPSPAAGAVLYPRLARYRDFYWSTLGAYGGGMLLAELVLILLQTFLSSGGGASGGGQGGLAPTVAFAVSLIIASLVAFGCGFVGAARARRLAMPEATIGVIYLGLPVPIGLTLMEQLPDLQVSLGYRLREVTYVADMLGRPVVGYWLVFSLLVLMLVLGINTGFIAAGSGRMDLRLGFELFVARRHVGVFRPSLVFGTLAVLLFGIVPPLIIYGIIRAVEAAVERTRIRELGLKDPLAAASALNRLKLREQSPTMMMTALSVGGVGVGVMALIIVLSVMSGFEEDLQNKILGAHSHVVVSKYAGHLSEYKRLMEQIAKVPGVAGQTPSIDNPVMVLAEDEVQGIVLKGIDPETVGSVLDLRRNMLPGGELDNLETPQKIAPRRSLGLGSKPSGQDDEEDEEVDPIIGKTTRGTEQKVLPGIILGRELATILRVVVGDRVNVISPQGAELGPAGLIPKSRAFRVAGIFYSGMYEYDAKFAYILLAEAQKLFNTTGPTGIELKVADVDDARRIATQVSRELGGYPYRARDWGEIHRNIFSALRLEKLVMGIILSIIIIVAAGLIVATVIMLVLEKRKEIAVLKALGVSDGGIVKIFLAEGLQIGVAGGLLGLFSGLAWCYFILKVGIKLDPSVYYIPNLPVKIEPVQTALAVVIAVLVTYLASIYPALKASSVEPVEGLKAE